MSSTEKPLEKNVRVKLMPHEWRRLRIEAADRDISLTALISDELSTSALALPEKART